MDQTGQTDESVLFSPNMPASVNAVLQAAVSANRSDKKRAEQLFAQALRLDTACLQSYFALYKFYFYQARLQEAENYALAGLKEAASQGGFPADYRQLCMNPPHWSLYADEISLFYLYTLKALAFIKLRQGRIAESQMILCAMTELDPKDLSGASVVRSLADSLAADNP